MAEWLNYHHLLYFWTVAREGGVARAAASLSLAQPTVSAQVKALEHSLGEQLFVRAGRRMTLTDAGRVVFRYADEIFAVGRELQDTLRGRPAGRLIPFVVGVADVLPKLIAYRLLEPALRLAEPVRVICRDDKPERLLSQLAVHEVDLVLSDAPVTTGTSVRAFSHLLGECGVTVFGAGPLVERVRRRFPRSLDGAPFLVPTEGTALRRALEAWFEKAGVRPRVVAEFEDSALLKVVGQAGHGLFAAPGAIEREVVRQYGVRVAGRVPEVRERFYAITVERRLKSPAALAISAAARDELFA